MTKELWQAILEEAERWISKQYTMADPQDPRNSRDAQARIELVDHLREVYLKND